MNALGIYSMAPYPVSDIWRVHVYTYVDIDCDHRGRPMKSAVPLAQLPHLLLFPGATGATVASGASGATGATEAAGTGGASGARGTTGASRASGASRGNWDQWGKWGKLERSVAVPHSPMHSLDSSSCYMRVYIRI